jgi:hypothetical protein
MKLGKIIIGPHALANVGSGSFAPIDRTTREFRSAPVNGHSPDRRACLKSAKPGSSEQSAIDPFQIEHANSATKTVQI